MNATPPDFRRARLISACSALTLLFTLATLSAFAQAPPAKHPQASPVSLLDHAGRVVHSIRASYYRPDQLQGFDCTIAVDWEGSFKGETIPPETLRVLQGLQIKVHSLRSADAELSFNWTDGRMDNTAQITEGLKLSLGGFFDVVYWPVIASPPVSSAAEITRIEAGPNGLTTVYSVHDGENLTTTLDSNDTPAQVIHQSTKKTTIYDFRFWPSPDPVPGDRRRLSNLDVNEHLGDTVTHMQFQLDYQRLDSYLIPRHAHTAVVGKEILDFELTGCSVPSDPL